MLETCFARSHRLPSGRPLHRLRNLISSLIDRRVMQLIEYVPARARLDELTMGVVMPLKEKRMGGVSRGGHSKVPAVTLGFWIIKIAATTLGETGGDAVSMSLNLGYAVSSVLFIGLFVVAVAAQIAVRSFHPFLYWLVVIATTTAGTTMADFADRSLGIGYAEGRRSFLRC